MAEVTAQGNSVILERNERWNAPGHNSIITDEAGQDWMLYHAIDTKNQGQGRVMLMDRVVYEKGWPAVRDRQPGTEAQSGPEL